MKLRDKFWLWGHQEGVYNHEYGNDKVSRMTPMEACLYLGVRNTFMTPIGGAQNVITKEMSFTVVLNSIQDCDKPKDRKY